MSDKFEKRVKECKKKKKREMNKGREEENVKIKQKPQISLETNHKTK